MFHIGHLNILKRAKEQCDYLIVGVSIDELVEQYKKKTPIICFEERIQIVEAIKYVDRVVPQITMNKFEAWKELKYNALFHGDDWKNSTLYDEYAKQLSEVGVELVFLPHTSGVSSTQLSQIISEYKENN